MRVPALRDTSMTFWPIVVCILLLLLGACEEQTPAKTEIVRPVRALQVADASNFKGRWFSGRAKGTQELDLSFRVSGPLIERRVDVGTEIAKGDIVALIDPATFRADVDRAAADLASAEAALANAVQQLKRKETLVQKGFETRAALDQFLANEKEARAILAGRKAALKRRRLDLDYTTLQAPFAGIVVKTYVENFQDVRAKEPIVRLVDNSRIEMIVNVPESLISQAHTVDRVIVTFDALPNVEITATVAEIGTEASETTRTYPVTLIMDQPGEGKILPGMAGRAKRADSVVSVGAPRIIVPDTAILTRNDPTKTLVWIVDEVNKTVGTRSIETGGIVDQGILVTGGLRPGEWIVTAGVNYLKEGQKVRILEE